MQCVCYCPMCSCVFTITSLNIISLDCVCGNASGHTADLQFNLQLYKCCHAITVAISSAALCNCNSLLRAACCLPASEFPTKRIPISLKQHNRCSVHLHLIYIMIMYVLLDPPNQQTNAFRKLVKLVLWREICGERMSVNVHLIVFYPTHAV